MTTFRIGKDLFGTVMTAMTFIGLCWAVAQAAKFIPVTVEELASGATCIVHGRVHAVEVSPAADGTPLTRVELTIESTWKGPSTNRIVVTQAGGTLGTRRVIVGGEAQYSPGEEVVVFLKANTRGEWLTFGMAQGKFVVLREDTRAWVSNPFFGGPPAPDGFRPANRLPLSLKELRQRTTEEKP